MAWSLSYWVSQVPSWDFATGLKSVTVSPPMSHQVRVNGLPSIVTVIAPV